MTVAQHGIFHSVAAQFVHATDGAAAYEAFWPWLLRRENHDLRHAFLAAWGPGYNEANAQAFIDVLAVEWDAWREANER